MLASLFKRDLSSLCAERRSLLVESIKQSGYVDKKGIVLLFGGLHVGPRSFLQESNFYYLTGLTDPGLVAAFDMDGSITVFMPAYGYDKAKWEKHSLSGTYGDQVKLL